MVVNDPQLEEKRRSVTLDEHDIKAQREQRMVTRATAGRAMGERKGLGGGGEVSPGRQRTWSHNIPADRDRSGNGDSRASAEWDHLDAFQV